MYNEQRHQLPTITPYMLRDNPDQTCDILNRLISLYQQFEVESTQAIKNNSATINIANDVVNGIQTDITNLNSDVGEIKGDIEDIETTIGNLATVATTGSYNDLIDKPTIPVITLQTTDPGEGATLAANHFIGVYQ